MFHYLSTVANSYRQEQEERLGLVRDETQSGQLPKQEGRNALRNADIAGIVITSRLQSARDLLFASHTEKQIPRAKVWRS
jgi:hypothetical protein